MAATARVDSVVVHTLMVAPNHGSSIHPGLLEVGLHLLGVCLLAHILHLNGLAPLVLQGNQVS
jgi:hypothetical protein